MLADSHAATLWGNELLLRDGEPAGFVTSAAFGHTVGRSVALALVARADAPIDEIWLESGAWSIDVAGERVAASISRRPPYDPASCRVRA